MFYLMIYEELFPCLCRSRSESVKRVPEKKKDSLGIQKPQTVSPPQRLLSSASVTSQIANERIKREEQSWLKRAGARLKLIAQASPFHHVQQRKQIFLF
ncbi:hypothetical protein R1flu_012558 [Riccia fluitans]|uniref:Uncharacterized protein n=1 Tax=Riccia fluitans TaxID=41844 RepID=A0ABD1ZBA1_9MARC